MRTSIRQDRSMRTLDLSSVQQWSVTNGFWHPMSIDTSCPHCGKAVNLAMQKIYFDTTRQTVAMTAACPRCRGKVHVWAVGPGSKQESEGKTCKCLAMYPDSGAPRELMARSDLIPDRIRRAYEDAVDALNAGLWSPAAVCCRRTLEGLVSNLLTDDIPKGNLADQLQQLSESETANLQKPLITLSHAVREGGNIGAHFDLERDTDRATAQAILELTEYFLEYVYTLPRRVTELEERLESL